VVSHIQIDGAVNESEPPRVDSSEAMTVPALPSDPSTPRVESPPVAEEAVEEVAVVPDETGEDLTAINEVTAENVAASAEATTSPRSARRRPTTSPQPRRTRTSASKTMR